jgi:hypothetical protein
MPREPSTRSHAAAGVSRMPAHASRAPGSRTHVPHGAAGELLRSVAQLLIPTGRDCGPHRRPRSGAGAGAQARLPQHVTDLGHMAWHLRRRAQGLGRVFQESVGERFELGHNVSSTRGRTPGRIAGHKVSNSLGATSWLAGWLASWWPSCADWLAGWLAD